MLDIIKFFWVHRIFLIARLVLTIVYRSTKKIGNMDVWYDPPKYWSPHLDGLDSSKQIFDKYSLTHFSGAILTWAILSMTTNLSKNHLFLWSMILHILFEIIENTQYFIDKFRMDIFNGRYTGDSLANILGDLYMAFWGCMLAYLTYPNIWCPMLVAGLVETTTYITTNVSLFRNIYLMIRPIPN